MYRSKVCAQIGVAFVGTHHKSARFCYSKVYAGKCGICCQELFPQVTACYLGEVFGVAGSFFRAKILVESFAHILFFEVNGGQHDVARSFVAQLNNAFAEVGINHIDTVLYKVRIEVALFGEHRFALHHFADTFFLEYIQDNFVVLVSIFCPMHVNAVFECILFKLKQIGIEL